jgi:hypothetical protein
VLAGAIRLGTAPLAILVKEPGEPLQQPQRDTVSSRRIRRARFGNLIHDRSGGFSITLSSHNTAGMQRADSAPTNDFLAPTGVPRPSR